MRFNQFLIVFILVVVVNPTFGAVADGIISVWTFDGGTARDLYGRNDGVLHGGVQFAEGKIGKAADLDGLFSYVEVPHSNSLKPLEHEMTICAWVYVRDTGRSAGIWKGERIEGGPRYLFRISFAAENQVGRMGWGGNTGAERGEGAFFSDEDYERRWMHVAEVLNGDTIQAYVDFQPVLAEPKRLKAPYALFPKEPIRIGMSQGIAGVLGNKTYLDGMIDEVALWGRGLSDEEIAQLGSLRRFLAVSPARTLAASWGAVKAYMR